MINSGDNESSGESLSLDTFVFFYFLVLSYFLKTTGADMFIRFCCDNLTTVNNEQWNLRGVFITVHIRLVLRVLKKIHFHLDKHLHQFRQQWSLRGVLITGQWTHPSTFKTADMFLHFCWENLKNINVSNSYFDFTMKPQGSLYHCTHSSCLCIQQTFSRNWSYFCPLMLR